MSEDNVNGDEIPDDFPEPKLPIISSETFKTELYDLEKDEARAGRLPTIVNFYATWCGPCKNFAPVLEKMADEFAGKLEIFKMDIDFVQDIPLEFGIRSVPTTLFIQPGQETVIVSGGADEQKMRAAIQEIFSLT